MKWTVYDRASQFLAATGEFLEREEAANNLLLGLSSILVQREQKGEATKGHLMFSVESGNGSLVLAILMNDKNLIVYGDGPDIAEAIKTAVAEIRRQGLQIPGVVGPITAASSLASEWAAQMQLEPVVRMKQLIYRLDEVNPIAYTSGQLKQAHIQDHDTVASWIYEFAESINENMTQRDAANKALEFIREGSLYMWVDDQPVSMARTTRPTRNGIVLSYVYTPPKSRGKGYATSCVASLSQRLLDNGYQFCSLYTDLSNPTSNHIYSEIGYRPVQESIMYRFK